MLQSLSATGPILAASIVGYVLWEAARPWLIVAVAASAVLLVVAVVIEPLWRYRVHRWETTDEAVYARSGWLVREWRAAPLARVQTVDAVPVEAHAEPVEAHAEADSPAVKGSATTGVDPTGPLVVFARFQPPGSSTTCSPSGRTSSLSDSGGAATGC